MTSTKKALRDLAKISSHLRAGTPIPEELRTWLADAIDVIVEVRPTGGTTLATMLGRELGLVRSEKQRRPPAAPLTVDEVVWGENSVDLTRDSQTTISRKLADARRAEGVAGCKRTLDPQIPRLLEEIDAELKARSPPEDEEPGMSGLELEMLRKIDR